MPRSESPWIRRLQEHLRNERNSRSILSSYSNAARCFIRETEIRNQSLETVSRAEVDEYLDALQLKRGRKKTTKPIRWLHSAAIKILHAARRILRIATACRLGMVDGARACLASPLSSAPLA